MYLGVYQLGQFVPVAALTLGAGFTPAWPGQVPLVRVYDGNGDCVWAAPIPPADLVGSTGFFAQDLRLDGSFDVGHYTVDVQWTLDGALRVATARFEVVAGGSADGAVIAMHSYRRPHADFLVERLDSSQRALARNPIE